MKNVYFFITGGIVGAILLAAVLSYQNRLSSDVCVRAPTVEVVPIAVQVLAEQLEKQRKYRKQAEEHARSLQGKADDEFWQEEAEESTRFYEEALKELVKRGLLKK